MSAIVLQISIRCNKIAALEEGDFAGIFLFFIKNLFLLQFPTKKGRE